ncbi:MAG: hypothetical protein E7033_08230 [Akkermansiaceae bacterium]|nr:hypothetical protein [Akkermansiaceae bacterium]
MKHLLRLMALSLAGLGSIAATQTATAQERITYADVQDGEQSVNYKFWVCIVGCPKQAVTAIRLDTIVSINKHTYTVDNMVIKEVTIDTRGNNSIRFYCMNNNPQAQKMAERSKNTRKLIDSKTGGLTTKPAKLFPDGTYSHNIEYLIDDPKKLDDIYESALNAMIRNRGCTYKVN